MRRLLLAFGLSLLLAASAAAQAVTSTQFNQDDNVGGTSATIAATWP